MRAESAICKWLLEFPDSLVRSTGACRTRRSGSPFFLHSGGASPTLPTSDIVRSFIEHTQIATSSWMVTAR